MQPKLFQGFIDMVSYSNTIIIIVEKSMSTTFNPYAFVVTAAMINTTKENITVKHPTEQSRMHQTHGQKLLVF